MTNKVLGTDMIPCWCGLSWCLHTLPFLQALGWGTDTVVTYLYHKVEDLPHPHCLLCLRAVSLVVCGDAVYPLLGASPRMPYMNLTLQGSAHTCLQPGWVQMPFKTCDPPWLSSGKWEQTTNPDHHAHSKEKSKGG